MCFAGSTVIASAQPAAPPLESHVIPIQLLRPIEDPPVLVITEMQIEEVNGWTERFEQWQRWSEKWLNRRQYGMWSEWVARTPEPDPPSWLAGACELLPDDEAFVRPCGMLAAWREDPLTTKGRQAAAAALQQQEHPSHTIWWQNLHIDGLWSTTQSNVSAFGVFGVHYTVTVAGRAEVFIAPGILLVSVPTIYGSRTITPAADWGISYRLFSVGRGTVHFNLAHAWLFAQLPGPQMPSMTLAGFSVTLRSRRQ